MKTTRQTPADRIWVESVIRELRRSDDSAITIWHNGRRPNLILDTGESALRIMPSSGLIYYFSFVTAAWRPIDKRLYDPEDISILATIFLKKHYFDGQKP